MRICGAHASHMHTAIIKTITIFVKQAFHAFMKYYPAKNTTYTVACSPEFAAP